MVKERVRLFKLFDLLKELTTSTYSLKRIQDLVEKSMNNDEIDDDTFVMYMEEVSKVFLRTEGDRIAVEEFIRNSIIDS